MNEVKYAAVKIALANGWSPDGEGTLEERTRFVKLHPSVVNLVDHDFAKALWGEKKHEPYYDSPCSNCGLYGTYDIEVTHCWERHLQYMVISDSAIRYLQNNMPPEPQS